MMLAESATRGKRSMRDVRSIFPSEIVMSDRAPLGLARVYSRRLPDSRFVSIVQGAAKTRGEFRRLRQILKLQGRASKIKLNGVCVARRNWEKPPAVTTSRRRFSPACAPSAKPTSWDSEAGVQISADAP